MKLKIIFLVEIRERELSSKNLSKYIASLDYFNKSLNILSISLCSIYIASFATIIGAPAGIAGASCGLNVFNYIRICKKKIENKK